MPEPLDLPESHGLVPGVPTAEGVPMPSAWQARREWRMAIELAHAAAHTRDLHEWPQGDGHPVIVLPGFLAGPESTVFLRSHLRRLGYRVHDWRQGRNLGASPQLAERLEDLLLEIHDRYERRVSLVGWSAGGIYAREMARALPDYTRAVITLGSPFRGHPASTRAWRVYRLMNRRNLEKMFTEEALATRAAPLLVPTSCIYSRNDGIVAWECCLSDPAPRTENIEVRATHLGYGHQYETLRIIADRLAQPEGAWMPYAAVPPPAVAAPPVPVALPDPVQPPDPPDAPDALAVEPGDAHERARRAHGRAG